MTKKAKNLKKAFGLVATGFGAVSTVESLRKARAKRDGLGTLHGILQLASVVVGAVVLIRSMRRGADEDGDS